MKRYKLRRSGRLCVISDVHIGAAEFDSRFFETIDWCAENDASIVLNGDILDNAIIAPGDKSAGDKLLGQTVMPTEQWKLALDIFRPHRKRIAFVTRGNHEARTRRASLYDTSDALAAALGVEYRGVGGLSIFEHGAQEYRVAIQHGKSGGSNTWREPDRLLQLYDAELVACGHNHDLNHREVGRLVIGEDGVERVEVRHQVRTGSYLGFADYVRESTLLPGRVGSPIISFGKTSHSIHVDVETLSWLPSV